MSVVFKANSDSSIWSLVTIRATLDPSFVAYTPMPQVTAWMNDIQRS